MAHSYSRLVYHIVFSTKYRETWLTNDIKGRIHAYLGGAIRGLNCVALAINGTADHVHLLAKLSAKIAVADAVREIKSNSSKWIHEQGLASRRCGWQTGYAAFTVSKSGEDAVEQYIANQEQHHRKMSFQEELLRLLDKHGIEFDERYLWD